MLGPSVTTSSKDQVVYSGSATKADADKLAQAMVKIGVFKKTGVLMVLSKDSHGKTISIPVRENEASSNAGTIPPPQPWQSVDFIAAVEAIGVQAASVLGGPPLTMRLVNTKGEPRGLIHVDHADAQIGIRDRVSYSGGATEADAKALGNALRDCGFFKDMGSVVSLAKPDRVPAITFHTSNFAEPNQRILSLMKAVGGDVAPSVGGPPINMRLIDDAKQTTQVVHIP